MHVLNITFVRMLHQVRLTVVCLWWYQYCGGQIQNRKNSRKLEVYFRSQISGVLYIIKM
jgi:hypothetical protein